MMKFSKTLLVVLGVVASLAFVGVMIYVVIQINQLHAVAIANRSAGFANPRNGTVIGAGLGVPGGLGLGLGVALPETTVIVPSAPCAEKYPARGARTSVSSAPEERSASSSCRRALPPVAA